MLFYRCCIDIYTFAGNVSVQTCKHFSLNDWSRDVHISKFQPEASEMPALNMSQSKVVPCFDFFKCKNVRL